MVQTGKTPQEIAEEMAAGKLDVTKLPTCSAEEAEAAIMPMVHESFEENYMQTAKRNEYLIDSERAGALSLCYRSYR